MRRYKVIRVFLVNAEDPMDAMTKASDQHIVFQKAVADETESFLDTARTQIRGKRKRG